MNNELFKQFNTIDFENDFSIYDYEADEFENGLSADEARELEELREY